MRNLYIVFTDLKGFSSLLEDEVMKFQELLVPELATSIRPYKAKAVVWNTWGDAIFAAFDDGNDAVSFMLDFRKFFRDFDFQSRSLKVLAPRIAGHFGPGQVIDDPILGGINLFGTNINTTARIEPVTRSGEIFVTKELRDAFNAISSTKRSVKFNELGVVKLAKDFGQREVFRLCESAEKDQIVDRILVQDLIGYLPDLPEASEEEKRKIAYYLNSPEVETLEENVARIDVASASLTFLFEVAKVLKGFGLFEKALTFLDLVGNGYLIVDEIQVYPYRHKASYLKLRANVLTRLRRYEDAADIVYGLWHSGHHDSDTLSMLAAQYKRRSIYGDLGVASRENLNYGLLNRSLNLYLEAFRRDIESYYSAINAAYIYKIIGGDEEGKGNKLAQYIVDSWENSLPKSWWLASTLAEAQVLLGDYTIAEGLFKIAIENHQPDRFEVAATSEQIEIYSKLRGLEKYTAGCLSILNTRRE